jgi:hypothetical protein
MPSSALVDGKIGKAVDFDGSNDRMRSTNPITFESFTFEAWAKADTWTNWRTFVSPNNDDRAFCTNAGKLTFWDTTERTIGPTLSGTAWKKVATTYNDSDTTQKLRGFVDASITTQTSNPSYDPITGIVNVASTYYSGAFVDFWNGKLDEIRISNITRSPAWIKASYYSESDQLINYGNQEYFYKIDHEMQWINLDYSQPNEELCIYGATMGSENLQVDVWTGSSWQNIITNLTSGWNNVTISAYLNSPTFTIRLHANNQISDTNQDTWTIDITLLHLWT